MERGRRWWRPYLRARWIAVWTSLGTADLVGACVVAAAALARWRGTVDQVVVDLISLLAAGFLVIEIVRAWLLGPFRLWREASQRLATFTEAPGVEVELGDEVADPHNGGLPLIWVRVTNLAPNRRTYAAQVRSTSGFKPLGPEDPWWIPWRHSWHRANDLMPGIPEMLLIASSGRGSSIVHVCALDGYEPQRNKAEWNDHAYLDASVFEADTGIEVSRFRLRLRADLDEPLCALERLPFP